METLHANPFRKNINCKVTNIKSQHSNHYLNFKFSFSSLKFFVLSAEEILLIGKNSGVILQREKNRPKITNDRIERIRRKNNTILSKRLQETNYIQMMNFQDYPQIIFGFSLSKRGTVRRADKATRPS